MVEKATEKFLSEIMGAYRSEYPGSHENEIRLAWDMMRSGNYVDALRFLLNCKIKQTVYTLDPIYLMLAVRSGVAILESKEITHDGILTAAKSVKETYACDMAVTVAMIESGLGRKFGTTLPIEIKKMYPNLLSMFQFALFQFMQSKKNEPRDQWNGEVRSLWKQYRLDEFYDFSGVDPFILELCPPYYTWNQYVIDNFVYEKEGEFLKKTPFALYDFKNNPIGKKSRNMNSARGQK